MKKGGKGAWGDGLMALEGGNADFENLTDFWWEESERGRDIGGEWRRSD